MKALLSILTLVISTTAFAQFDMLQNEIARTVVQIDNVSANIKSIKLNESGVLTIVPTEGFALKSKLTTNNSEALLNMARTLAETEVATEERAYVCEMMMVHGAQNLTVIDLDTNALRLVLSPAGCSFATYTRPSDEASLGLAKTLKAQLVVLAQSLVTSM